MSGRWEPVGPGRSVFRLDVPGEEMIGPDALLPYLSPVPVESMLLMWLIYEACGSCGAAAKRPCLGVLFGAHAGRETRWARAERERER